MATLDKRIDICIGFAMMDLRVSGFDWDEGNRAKSSGKPLNAPLRRSELWVERLNRNGRFCSEQSDQQPQISVLSPL